MLKVLIASIFLISANALKLQQSPEFDLENSTYDVSCGDRNNYKCWKKGGHSVEKSAARYQEWGGGDDSCSGTPNVDWYFTYLKEEDTIGTGCWQMEGTTQKSLKFGCTSTQRTYEFRTTTDCSGSVTGNSGNWASSLNAKECSDNGSWSNKMGVNMEACR